MKQIIAGLVTSLSCACLWATPVGYGGHFYDVVVDSQITWQDARAAALSRTYSGLQGHLVTITSAGEDLAVGNMMAQASAGGEFWAGGFQNPLGETDPRAGWTWVNGEGAFPGVNGDPSGIFTNWNGGEPNDAYGAGSEQYLGLNLGSVGGFNDEGNLSLIAGYVIEYDPTTINDVPDGGEAAFALFTALAALSHFASRRRRAKGCA